MNTWKFCFGYDFFFSKNIEIYLCIQENIVKKNIYSGVPYYLRPPPPKNRPESVLGN